MQHLAIIPDGNRRWAKNNKLKTLIGHKQGLDTFDIAIRFCIKNEIKFLSIYTFSMENFSRSEDEKAYLFDLLIEQAEVRLNKFVENEIKINFLGDRNCYPEKTIAAIEKMEEQTKNFNKLNLNLLFCYGSKFEIISAAKDLAKKVQAGVLAVEDINENEFGKCLWTSGTPDPDLIIRTGFQRRLSNFLLYQAAYSEFMFLDCLWPEVTEVHLQKCLEEFKKIQKNFGK